MEKTSRPLELHTCYLPRNVLPNAVPCYKNALGGTQPHGSLPQGPRYRCSGVFNVVCWLFSSWQTNLIYLHCPCLLGWKQLPKCFTSVKLTSIFKIQLILVYLAIFVIHRGTWNRCGRRSMQFETLHGTFLGQLPFMKLGGLSKL